MAPTLCYPSPRSRNITQGTYPSVEVSKNVIPCPKSFAKCVVRLGRGNIYLARAKCGSCPSSVRPWSIAFKFVLEALVLEMIKLSPFLPWFAFHFENSRFGGSPYASLSSSLSYEKTRSMLKTTSLLYFHQQCRCRPNLVPSRQGWLKWKYSSPKHKHLMNWRKEEPVDSCEGGSPLEVSEVSGLLFHDEESVMKDWEMFNAERNSPHFHIELPAPLDTASTATKYTTVFS